MPIKVQCACGAAFAAKDELAGRTVKCPKCQKPLKIPAGAAAPLGSSAPGQRSAAAPGGRQLAAPLPSQGPAGPAADMHGHFDEVGLKAQQAGTAPCPGCAHPMPVNAVVCIQCGYNRKLGRRMETVKNVEAAPLPGGHNVTVDDLLHKAAASIEEDKEEQRKKNREGMPWWVYLIGMICVIGFMVAMMVLPPQIAVMTGGIIMYVVTFGITIYAKIRIIMIAFGESVAQGICVIVIPCYDVIFIFMHWDQCGWYFIIVLATNIVRALLDFALQSQLENLEEDAYRLEPAPAAVAKADFDYYVIPLRKGEA